MTRDQNIAVFSEERNLLAPLYRKVPNPRRFGEGRNGFLCLTHAASYTVFSRGEESFQFPEFRGSKNWDEASTLRVAGRLVMASEETIGGLQGVYGEWVDCMTGYSALVRAEALEFSGEYFSSTCEFSGVCSDAVLALFMVLTATRGLTSVEAVGFFHPEDYATQYQKIGDPAKSRDKVEKKGHRTRLRPHAAH